MAFDSLGILRGLYSSALVAMDENDAVATSETANSDGNAVVEINGTGAKGLAAVLIFTEEADSNSYDDEGIITIQASDYLDKNWEEVARFPVIHCHLKQVDITATTAFVAADIGQDLTEETSTDTGKILWYDPALETIGGRGIVIVEMDDSGDLFDAAVGKTETSGGTGVGTKNVAIMADPQQMLPGAYVVRFATDKKYVRCNCESVEDSLGKAWILLTDAAFTKI